MAEAGIAFVFGIVLMVIGAIMMIITDGRSGAGIVTFSMGLIINVMLTAYTIAHFVAKYW
jgi:hypothetical protein